MDEIMIQEYIIHLLDGSKIITREKFEVDVKEGIINRFDGANDTDLLEICDLQTVHYIPKKSILYITVGPFYYDNLVVLCDD